MKTNPDSLHDAQVPLVTIIVKVPHIAIKYPMTNGQVIDIPFETFFTHQFPRSEDFKCVLLPTSTIMML